MPGRSPSSILRHCLAGLVAVAVLAAAPVAIADPAAPAVSAASPTRDTSIAVSWSAVGADLGYVIDRYEGGADGAVASFDGALSTTVALDPGTHTFRVRAVERSVLDPLLPEIPGPFGTKTIVVDQTPPAISVALRPGSPNGNNGWYRDATADGGSRLVVDWTCSDANGIAACPGDETVGSQGAGQTRSGSARDLAGNVNGPISTPEFKYDGARPNPGPMRAPSPNALVSAEPTFVWGAAPGSETSGFDRYEVLVRIGGTYRVVVRVGHVAGRAEYSARRDPSLYSAALPINTDLRWYVRTFDNAGNSGGGTSQSRAFRIDPSIPGPPTFTGGPAGPTNVAGPTFSWTGSQPSYTWDVSVSGTETTVLSGNGPQTQANLSPLPDGDYTFAVSQVTAAGGRGAEATRSFQVDTAAPPAPVITQRPPFPTNSGTPSFAWSTEPGAYSRWRVLAAGGNAVQSSDTPLTSTTVGPLGDGAYNFRVTQVDAAGNESAPALEPFSIVGAGPASRKSPFVLPKQNAGRLRPKAGKLLYTRRPILRWTGAPRGTTLFNLQVFRVQRARTAGKTPSVKKIYSVFPAKRRYKMPSTKILAGTCYVWRVWPFVGDRFTGTPLGVSNFCIASTKALRKAAARRAKLRGR